jgi:hypothetical protein
MVYKSFAKIGFLKKRHDRKPPETIKFRVFRGSSLKNDKQNYLL